MNISYVSSKAVKINSDMRNDLNFYNQRQKSINDYNDEIATNQKLIDTKNAEISSLQGVVNSEDKRESREAIRRIKSLQREIERLVFDNSNFESKMNSLSKKQNAANKVGVQMKTFPKAETDALNNVVDNSVPMDNNITSNYKEQESFVPASDVNEPSENVGPKLSNQDIEAIWNGLHQQEDSSEPQPENTVSEPVMEPAPTIEPAPVATPEPSYEQTNEPEPVEPAYEQTDEPAPVEPVYEPVSEPAPVEPVYETPEEEEPKIIEPIVINEEPINVETEVKENEEVEENEGEETTVEHENPKDDVAVSGGLEQEIHEEVKNEFPKIAVPEPMDSEDKLHSIYNELDVEPKMPDTSTPRDLKNLTLFVDYNDYTFAFAQQHYDKEALTPDEIENLTRVKGYLTEKDFSSKRTTQYNKITAENKRLNKKIVSLSKEFTKTIDKLSKEYVSTTEELTNQTLKATEQIEIDRVEKVQTQRLNESLTNNIKDQASHIEDLMGENKNLKETLAERDNTIKDLEQVVSDQADKIKVFEEKLNTVLGIVKEVKGEKKNANKE